MSLVWPIFFFIFFLLICINVNKKIKRGHYGLARWATRPIWTSKNKAHIEYGLIWPTPFFKVGLMDWVVGPSRPPILPPLIISCCVLSRNIVKLTREDMNEMKYSLVLGGVYLVWNLRVAHVDPMSWSILVNLGPWCIIKNLLIWVFIKSDYIKPIHNRPYPNYFKGLVLHPNLVF